MNVMWTRNTQNPKPGTYGKAMPINAVNAQEIGSWCFIPDNADEAFYCDRSDFSVIYGKQPRKS